MIISTSRYRSRKDNTSGIHCLPNPLEMTSPCDLLDEQGRQTFRTEFLVDTKEIDFDTGKCVCTHSEGDWDTGDESAEFTFGIVGCAETHVP